MPRKRGRKIILEGFKDTVSELLDNKPKSELESKLSDMGIQLYTPYGVLLPLEDILDQIGDCWQEAQPAINIKCKACGREVTNAEYDFTEDGFVCYDCFFDIEDKSCSGCEEPGCDETKCFQCGKPLQGTWAYEFRGQTYCGECPYYSHPTFEPDEGCKLKFVCSEEEIQCSECGKPLEEPWIYTIENEVIDNKHFCNECYVKVSLKKEQSICFNCGKSLDGTSSWFVNRQYWCDDCYNDHQYTCFDCGKSLERGSGWFADGRLWCFDCYGNHKYSRKYKCSKCKVELDGVKYFMDGLALCGRCYKNHIASNSFVAPKHYCSECQADLSSTHSFEFNGFYYCWDCISHVKCYSCGCISDVVYFSVDGVFCKDCDAERRIKSLTEQNPLVIKIRL